MSSPTSHESITAMSVALLRPTVDTAALIDLGANDPARSIGEIEEFLDGLVLGLGASDVDDALRRSELLEVFARLRDLAADAATFIEVDRDL